MKATSSKGADKELKGKDFETMWTLYVNCGIEVTKDANPHPPQNVSLCDYILGHYVQNAGFRVVHDTDPSDMSVRGFIPVTCNLKGQALKVWKDDEGELGAYCYAIYYNQYQFQGDEGYTLEQAHLWEVDDSQMAESACVEVRTCVENPE